MVIFAFFVAFFNKLIIIKFMTKALSIYIHYPFCKSKCPYCDFNSHIRANIDYGQFLEAYLRELDYFSNHLKDRIITTIFFGGGTPSLMPTSLVEKILQKIGDIWTIKNGCEITLEANPTSFEGNKFCDFKKAGINRLSLGIQALNDADLKFLGRQHTMQESIAVINKVAEIFDNFSFDLIYARPNQTLDSWQNELEQALKFNSNHLSLYQLTIEKGTSFFSDYQKKKFILPNEDCAADFYDLTNKITAQNGYDLYEISNYSKNGFQCQHNLVYWQGGDYLGIGAGAHSRVFFDGEKNRHILMMTNEPKAWLQKVIQNGVGTQIHNKITMSELLEELILMALRLKTGLENDRFLQITQKNLREVFDYKLLQKLENQGLIVANADFIKIPQDKLVLTNAIIAKVCDAILP